MLKLLDIYLIIYLSISSAMSQWYGLKHGSHINPIRCKEQYVSSLLHCSALGGELNDLRFFINIENKYCRWKCMYTFLNTTETQDKDWNLYGMFYFENNNKLLSY